MAEKIEATMDEKFDKAAADLMAISFRPGAPLKPEEAMKASQAILNLAHAKQLFSSKK